MYVTTFYSFKGGVGRTLALVNCAFELMQRGKRVLLVDFDLEAPGISSFPAFSSCADQSGLVDYVCRFVATGEAPDAAQYLHECMVGGKSSGRLWVMPAGKQDASYGARLNSVDWNDLYERYEGYLMFEDLKAQWKQEINPDYVLVDSRTGHTDIGGICTRHLPDAVAFLFFPNEQNITGLHTIVDSVREEKSKRRKDIALHFVPSRVPDLDDEVGTLQAWIERSQKSLTYENPSAVIHHYDSMELLDQVLFTDSHPGSRLSREYRTLVDAIISRNLEDREGALATIDQILSQFSPSRSTPLDFDVITNSEERLSSIAKYHPRDGEILFRMALYRTRIGDASAALLLLDAAVVARNVAPRVYFARASAHCALGHDKDAGEDLISVLRSDEATPEEVERAIYRLRQVAPERIQPGIETLSGLSRLPARQLNRVASAMLVSRSGAEVAEALIKRLFTDETIDEATRDDVRITLSLGYIARGLFNDALELLRVEVAAHNHVLIQDQFNFSVASWGRAGKPEPGLFANVIEHHKNEQESPETANYNQALAIAYKIVGDREHALKMLEIAREALLANPRTEFSAWRYLEVRPALFLADLDAMHTWIMEDRGTPLFMCADR